MINNLISYMMILTTKQGDFKFTTMINETILIKVSTKPSMPAG